MAAPALWQPQEQGLREICTLLEAHISPNSDQARIWQQLQHYSQFPDFNNYLVFLLARGEGKSIEVRQAAGLLLKNNLRATFSSMPLPSQQYIKSELLPCIGATNRAIRSTVGTVISVLFQIVRVAGWIELFQALHKCLDSNDLDHMEGAMDAIYKICEDVPEELDIDVPGLPERPINVFVPRILQFFQSPHASLRKLALGCINQYIVVMPLALYMSMDQYLQGLFNLAKDPSADVRKLVCSAWVQLIEVRPSILEPHLKNVTELILQANKDSDDEVALEACEFWSAYCDVSMPPEGLREFLPRLIPTLLSNMVYADDDESLADAEEDESFPDRDQDLKPRFHASRLHGSETGEDDDDADAVNVWNLRKRSAAGLDVLSNVFGDSILPTLMPLIEQNLARTDDDSWKERETAVLSLGAIAEGCIAGLYPHLPQIVAFLIPLLDDKFPLIRSITCWTLSRYSKFIVQSLDHPNGREQFDKILMGLLRRILDTNERVQEAACSAFATLEEEAAEELVPHLEVILQHLMCAYGKYQRRNLRILYDALGTLADAVGAELNQAKYLDIFMPPLITKWQQLQNSDKDLFPLLECFTSIAQALGPGFAQFAEPVFQRCINLIQSQQLAKIGKEIEPVVISVVSCLVPILKSPEGLNKSLIENSAITLGRLSWVCPDIMAPHMDHFMQAWCSALRMVRDDFEKEDAFHGLCAMVAANPSGAVGSLAHICQACASWTEIKSEGLHSEVCQILNGYKQLLGNSGWEQCMATLEPAVVQRLARYVVESNQLAAAEEKREAQTKKAEVDFEEEEGADSLFAAQTSSFRDIWITLYSRYFGHFEDTTKIPNMRFTYKKPDLYQSSTPTITLQIFSIKVARIRGNLQWPLHVFGKVAVRDVVDHNRNMIFDCPRESCQILNQEVPYLKLTGPTRAVVLVDPVTFEADLKVKGITHAEDECLSFLAVRHINFTSLQSKLIKNDYASKLSTLEFEIGHIVHSVEATIFVRVKMGSWPDGFRGQFAARTASIGEAEVILLDSGDDRVHVSRGGSIRLSRCVTSVEIDGKLEVCVKAGRGEEIVVGKKKVFKPKKDGASHGTLGVGFCTLDITVAWSIVSVYT